MAVRGVGKKPYPVFPHGNDWRKDSRMNAVIQKYGPRGYGVVMMMIETMCQSPMLTMEFRYEEHELLNLGLQSGDRIFAKDFFMYCKKVNLFSIENYSDVYYVIGCPMLNEALAPKINGRKRQAVYNSQIDAEKKAIYNKNRRKKMVIVEEQARLNIKIRQMQRLLDFNEGQMEEAQKRFASYDVRQYAKFFREEYVVNELNLELYLNTVTKESAFALFVRFMFNEVLSLAERERIADNAAQKRAIDALQEFKLKDLT